MVNLDPKIEDAVKSTSCAKCPQLLGSGGRIQSRPARKTDWRPPAGIDPKTREFRCRNNHTTYQVIMRLVAGDPSEPWKKGKRRGVK